MGPPRCPAWGTLVALRMVISVLKTLEPNFKSRQPGNTMVWAADGGCGSSAQGNPSWKIACSRLGPKSQPWSWGSPVPTPPGRQQRGHASSPTSWD